MVTESFNELNKDGEQPIRPPTGSGELLFFMKGEPSYWTFMNVYTNFGVCFQVSKESSRANARHTFMAVTPCCGGTAYVVSRPKVTTTKDSVTATNTSFTTCGFCSKLYPCQVSPAWELSLDIMRPDVEALQNVWDGAAVNPLLRHAVLELLFSRVEQRLRDGDFTEDVMEEALNFPRGAS